MTMAFGVFGSLEPAKRAAACAATTHVLGSIYTFFSVNIFFYFNKLLLNGCFQDEALLLVDDLLAIDNVDIAWQVVKFVVVAFHLGSIQGIYSVLGFLVEG